MSDSLLPQHTRLPCPSLSPGVCLHSCPLSQWSHPSISSSVTPFSFCLQSFPEPGSFQMSQLFASGGQSIGASASAIVLPMNIQDWFPLGWTGWICLPSKGLSRVFSSITIWKHQFFSISLLYGPTLTSIRDYYFQMYKLGLEKAEELRSNCQHSLDHRESIWNYPAHKNWLHIWGLISLSDTDSMLSMEHVSL